MTDISFGIFFLFTGSNSLNSGLIYFRFFNWFASFVIVAFSFVYVRINVEKKRIFYLNVTRTRRKKWPSRQFFGPGIKVKTKEDLRKKKEDTKLNDNQRKKRNTFFCQRNLMKYYIYLPIRIFTFPHLHWIHFKFHVCSFVLFILFCFVFWQLLE